MTVSVARRKALDAARYHRGKVCEECGVPHAKHRWCAACGCKVGLGHEPTVREPKGKHQVCVRCYQYAHRFGWWVITPHNGKHHDETVIGGMEE